MNMEMENGGRGVEHTEDVPAKTRVEHTEDVPAGMQAEYTENVPTEAQAEPTKDIPMGTRYVASERILPKESAYTKGLKEHYLYFFRLSVLYGMIYAFCMYRNPAGITFPLLVALTLAFAALCLKKIRSVSGGKNGEIVRMAGGDGEAAQTARVTGEDGKKDGRWFRTCTLPYLADIALVGISTCLTANEFFHFFNKVAIVMLFSAAMLHQLYEDGKWSFPLYVRNLFVLWGSCIASVGKVFSHAATYRAQETQGAERRKKTMAVMRGVGMACLVLVVVLPLLISSDLIIVEMLEQALEDINIAEGVLPTFDIFVGMVSVYSFFAGLFRQNVSGEMKGNGKRAESLTGITFVSILAVVYVFYAAVQIIYLFLRAGTLPGDLTYSQYAHEGFWQLVMVSVINIVMVLICMQVFQKHKVLNGLLLVISLCTCVMTASAAYRMVLYVDAYHLTFLRILVLWFLGVLALVMVGMMVAIFRTGFPLFQYSVAVLTCCYIAFSFVRVDAVIASYNMENMEYMRMNDVWYLMSLSEDAAPYVARIEPEMVVNLEEDYANWSESDENFLDVQKRQYFEYILQEDMSLRQWNYGMARAKDVAGEYLRGE